MLAEQTGVDKASQCCGFKTSNSDTGMIINDEQNYTSSAMEMDDQMNGPKFSINVLELFNRLKSKHGLLLGDYARYRRCCTARLGRLYKSLKLTLGCGKYSKRAITASMITDVRYYDDAAWVLRKMFLDAKAPYFLRTIPPTLPWKVCKNPFNLPRD